MGDDKAHEIQNIEWSIEDVDLEETHEPITDTEFSFSLEFEAPPRDIRKLFRADETVEIESNLPNVDGEYRQCAYCEDALVEVDYYDEHLEEEHNLER